MGRADRRRPRVNVTTMWPDIVAALRGRIKTRLKGRDLHHMLVSTTSGNVYASPTGKEATTELALLTVQLRLNENIGTKLFQTRLAAGHQLLYSGSGAPPTMHAQAFTYKNCHSEGNCFVTVT